jgi:putative CocE/NonD family hydrolase
MLISEPAYEFQVAQNVPVPMRDGTILRADVYRPQAAGRYPVLVGRVGYKLRDWLMDFYTPTGAYYARRGYVVVWQNVRGTFASEGRFHPFVDDAWGANRDGYDTIEWAAQQSWSNGKVAMLGVSYSGLT